MLALQIMLTKKSLIIKLFSQKSVINKTETQRLTEKSLLQKKEKGGEANAKLY